MKSVIPIYDIQGHKVVLDSDLAALYQVPTKVFNQAIKRNRRRFPVDFSFEVNAQDLPNLRSQIVTPKSQVISDHKDAPITSQAGRSANHGGRRSLPRVFTEHGALMAATILNSDRAVEMSVFVIRAFIQMREEFLTNSTILKRLAEIDKTLLVHDSALHDVYLKLLPLLQPPPDRPKPKIGFKP